VQSRTLNSKVIANHFPLHLDVPTVPRCRPSLILLMMTSSGEVSQRCGTVRSI